MKQLRMFLLLVATLMMFVSPAMAELTVYYLDVGQADAAVIECDSHYMMIDGGNEDDSQYVYSFLTKTLGIRYLDYVVATHPHEDHIGGLAAALRACDVGTLFSPVDYYDSKCFQSMLKYSTAQIEIPWPNDWYPFGSATITFLNQYGASYYEDINDWSLIVAIDYGDTSFLFTGDMESDAEYDLLYTNADLHADVLKVGHHGSNTSTSEDFIAAVSPTYAVISCGIDNSYGHPTKTTLTTLQEHNVTLYRTDLQGTIICHSDGQSLTFETERTATTADLFTPAGASSTSASASEGTTVTLGSIIMSSQAVWSKPSTNSNRLGTLYYGDEVEVVETYVNRYWHRILYNGDDAYIPAAYIKLSDDTRIIVTSTQPPATSMQESIDAAYVGNANSLKFHDPTCKSVSKMKEANKVYFDTRDEAIAAGYAPCGSCNP